MTLTKHKVLQKRQEEGIIGTTVYDNIQYEVGFCAQLINSTALRGTLLVLLIALIPILCMLLIDFSTSEDAKHRCSYNVGRQITCGGQNTTKKECISRKCCFNITDYSCMHTIPSYYIYNVDDDDTADGMLLTSKMERTPFDKDADAAFLNYIPVSEKELLISLSAKFEKSMSKHAKTIKTDTEYTIKKIAKGEIMTVEVTRNSNQEIIFSTSRGPTIVSKRYLEWSVDLNTAHLYGMDFLRAPDDVKTTRVLYKNEEDHSSVARFMAYQNGSFHGLEVVHNGLLEVTILPSRLIVLRLLSGEDLKLRLLTGPSPQEVVKQFGGVANAKIPYWALGVHMCRDGKITNVADVLKDLTQFLNANKDLPYDSDCIHENLFSLSMDVNNEIKQAISTINTDNKKFVMSLSPQVIVGTTAYEEAERKGILYKRNKTIIQGSYLGMTVVYPDYNNNEAWYKNQFDQTFSGINIDGLVLRNSWPVDDENELISSAEFQYLSEVIRKAMKKTLPWDSHSPTSLEHIQSHNSYGYEYARAVSSAAANSHFLLSAVHTSNNQFATHSQNVNITWADFKNSLIKTLSNSLFSENLHSIPVCGSINYKINPVICARWYLAAATFPLFRISSEAPYSRDPSSFSTLNHYKKIALKAIETRYKLLPYYYTTIALNQALLKPMFMDFYQDENTLKLDAQYMIGDALLVAHPLLFPVPNIRVYLPNIAGGWYEFWGGVKLPELGWINMPIVEDDLVAYIAAGKVIPLQAGVAKTAEETRKLPLNLVAALNNKNAAEGQLFVGDSSASQTVKFAIKGKSLQISDVKVCSSTSTGHEFSISNIQVYSQDVKYCKLEKQFCFEKGTNFEFNFASSCTVYHT